MPALAADAIVELLLVAAFLVMFGMLVAYKYSLSPVLLTIAHLFQSVSIPLPFHHVHPLRFAAKALIDVDHSVIHWLSVGVSASEGGIVAVYHATANMVAWTGRVLAELAEGVYAHAVHLEHVTLPRLLRDGEKLARRLTAHALHEIALVEHKLTRLVESKIAATWRHIAAVERAADRAIDAALVRAEHYTIGEVAKAYRYADALEHRLLAGIDRLRADLTRLVYHGIDELRGWVDAQLQPIRRELDAIAGVLPKVEGGITSLEREVQGLEGLFAAGAFAAAVAVALDAIGLSWTKCKGVGKVGRRLCGLGDELLDFLLGATIDALVVYDLCEIIDLEAKLARELLPEVEAFVGVLDAMIGCHGASKPRPVALTTTALPVPVHPLTFA